MRLFFRNLYKHVIEDKRIDFRGCTYLEQFPASSKTSARRYSKVAAMTTAASTLTCKRYNPACFLDILDSKLYLGSISAFLERIIHFLHRHY